LVGVLFCHVFVQGTIELKTTVESTPKPANVVRSALDVNLSWLLQRLNDKRQASFSIDRSDVKKCCTPRRNPQAEAALEFGRTLSSWCDSVRSYFLHTLLPVQADHGLDLSTASNESGLFVPVVPLFEKQHTSKPPAAVQPDAKDSKGAFVGFHPAHGLDALRVWLRCVHGYCLLLLLTEPSC
jgi:hypothetical protein